MGSGKSKPGNLSATVQTSGQAGSDPDSSRSVSGLPLRSTAAKENTSTMAGKEEVFGNVSNIFVVMGASVNKSICIFFSSFLFPAVLAK